VENQKEMHFGKTLTVVNAQSLGARLSMPHTFVVCGSSRGGTSAIAYAMIRGGIDLGSDLPINLEDPEVLSHIDGEKLNEDALSQIIAARSGRTWGFKVPDAAFHLPWFANHAENPIFVVILRSPLAVANSIINREPSFSKDKTGFAVAFRHPLKFFGAISSALPKLNAPFILMDYEGLHYRSDVFLDELYDLLGIDCEDRKEVATELSKSDYKALPSTSKIEGFVDRLNDSEIRGWARRLGASVPLRIEIVHNNVVVNSCIANLPREDLTNAGKGDCAFKIDTPASIPISEIRARIAGTHVFLNIARPAGGETAA
jgi:hypothetical protein